MREAAEEEGCQGGADDDAGDIRDHIEEIEAAMGEELLGGLFDEHADEEEA